MPTVTACVGVSGASRMRRPRTFIRRRFKPGLVLLNPWMTQRKAVIMPFRHRNGSDYFVKGDHFDQFENNYYAPDDSSYTPYDTPVQRDISPGLIEGIHLGKGEVENPSIFWGQHKKGGTAESFQEMASHIPEVRARLAAGETLDDLARDDKLSACVGIYFRNMPEVIEWDGYYEFSSNGRHRILAARALGHDIPVKVIGKRSWHKAGK